MEVQGAWDVRGLSLEAGQSVPGSSITPPLLAIPETQPWAPTPGFHVPVTLISSGKNKEERGGRKLTGRSSTRKPARSPTSSLLARIFKVGVQTLCGLKAPIAWHLWRHAMGGSGGMLPQKILKNWSLLDMISAILTAVNVFKFTY